MLPEDLAPLVKRLRKTPLYQNGGGADPWLGRSAIESLLPHRDPFLLVDEVLGLDREARTIRGRVRLRTDDPVFKGHFPSEPVYPGVLQVEAMGQLGLCLARLMGDPATSVRATHIHHASFFAPVRPGDVLDLYAGLVDESGWTAISAGQVYRGGELCACAVQEVYFAG